VTGPAPARLRPAAAGQFEWILGPWLDESHGGGRRTVGWRAHPNDRPTDTLAVLLNFEASTYRSTWNSAGRGSGSSWPTSTGSPTCPPDGTSDPNDPTALHSTDGRFASFTLPSSSSFIYKWTTPEPPPDRVSSAADAGRDVGSDPAAGEWSDQTGTCQIFARNCATRSLASPHHPTLDNASHLLGRVGK
jgi:hypothetical protein